MKTDTGYHELADAYAAHADRSPQNVFYERPATLSLLPDLAGLRVLDVGCGSGWYAEHFVEAGARVTAFDAVPRFVELTRARVGDRARVLHADLGRPLPFAAGEFDLVVASLVLHYLEDWRLPLSELARVLQPGGRLVFSTHHPFTDWQNFDTGNYFRRELLVDEWEIGTIRFYRRSLTEMSESLAAAGLLIERILEPRPVDEYRTVNPDWFDRLNTTPWFLLVRARLDSHG